MINFIRNKLTCSRFTVVPIVCFLTILTYGEVLPSAIRDYIAYAIWGIVLIECFFSRKLRLTKQSLTFLGLGFLFYFFVIILVLVEPSNRYLSSGVVSTFGISLMLFFCGSVIGYKLNQDDVEVICRWFVIGALVMGSFWFFQNISNGFNLTSRIYNNVSFNKNSASQLISSAICILIIGFNRNKEKKNTALRILAALFLTIILLLMRSRACILSFSIAIVIMLSSRYTNKRIKRWIVAVLGISTIVVLANGNLREILVRQILYANRDVSSLDNLTSGRMSIYSQFWDLVRGKELVGNGALYYECFYLSVIVQFGFPVGLYLWGYVLYMLHSLKMTYKSFHYGWLLMILAISYSLNGVFEGLPPFGPGTKNFLLWLLFGMASTHVLYAKKEDEAYNYE